jgi:prepilin-type N-terminal cleavage/methylation domain-containing protein
MKRRSKRAFTLLEIMICLVLIGLLGGVVGFKIKGTVAHHRFRNRVNQIEQTLRELQILALTYRTDMSLDLFQQKEKWVARVNVEEPKLQFLNQKKIDLSDLSINAGPDAVKKIHLDVLSSGRILSPCSVICFQHGKDSRFLDLRLGLHIKVHDTYPELKVPMLPRRCHEPKKQII